MQGLSGNMLLCLLILIGLTSGEYSFYFFSLSFSTDFLFDLPFYIFCFSAANANFAPVIGNTDFDLCEDTPTSM